MKLVGWSFRMEVIGVMSTGNRNWLCMTALLVMVAVAGGLADARKTTVIRGAAGPETVTVNLGDGISATWHTRTGTLEGVERKQSNGKTDHLLGKTVAPSWFIQSDGGNQLVSYEWKGYRFKGDQVILLHELTEVDGQALRVEERPSLQEDESGLLSMTRTFKIIDSKQVRLVKRVRTATLESVTVPVRTNGTLKPLGLNDNWMADVVFKPQGPTWITTVFNGQWADQPSTPSGAEEKAK